MLASSDDSSASATSGSAVSATTLASELVTVKPESPNPNPEPNPLLFLGDVLELAEPADTLLSRELVINDVPNPNPTLGETGLPLLLKGTPCPKVNPVVVVVVVGAPAAADDDDGDDENDHDVGGSG